MSERLRSGVCLIALGAALGCACWAQQLQQRSASVWGFIVAAFALGLLGGRCLSLPSRTTASHCVPSLIPSRPRWLAVGIVALALCLVLQATALAPISQIIFMALSLISWIAAYLPNDGSLREESRTLWAARAALLFIALASCSYALDRIPGNLYGDEASLGSDVVRLLDGTKPVPPFGLGWGRSPALFTWFEAAGVSLFGGDIGGLRVAAVVGGALAVLPWFGMLRRELGAGIAAASVLLLCASPAHQHLSRMAMSEAWIRVCSFGALASLYIALCGGRSVAYVATGVALGCCFYMANKAVLLPPVLVGAGIFLVLALLPKSLSHWRGFALTLSAALLAFLPQLFTYHIMNGWGDAFIRHPARWMKTPYSQGQLAHAEEVLRLLWDRSEMSPFTPFDYGSRIVSQVEGALMVVGLGVSLARPCRPIAAFLLGWLVAGMASLWLDARPNQMPHAILVSCLPAAFAALVLHAWQQAASRVFNHRGVGRLAMAVCAAPLILWNASAYFGRGEGAAPWFGAEFTALGKAMQEYRDSHYEVLVTPRMSWDLNSTLLYFAPRYRAPVKLTELDATQPWLGVDVPRDVAFLVSSSQQHLVGVIQNRYPQAELDERRSAAGRRLLTVVRVPAFEVRRVEEALRNAQPK